ncbi:MAG: hypothetical protein E6G97_03335 [Alphaproteobacteria bacterium]|nr:MAG: hypothetical protein E6G97_03335 [Alphaproteobacteria bacterium]
MIGFPLLIIPFAIYNMIAFLTPGFDWASRPYTFPLKSGVEWGPSFADAFLVFSLLMLMFEMIKSTRHGRSIVEHFLVLLLACGAAAEFVLVKEAANSTFLLFAAICFVDLFAGFAAALRRARRAVVVEQAPVVVPAAPAPVARTEPARLEPVTRVEPSPFEPRPEPVLRTGPVQKIEP